MELEFDLDAIIADEEYGRTLGDVLKEEVVNYIRNYIRESFLKNHHKMMDKWIEDYLAGKQPQDPPGVVCLTIPVDLIRGK